VVAIISKFSKEAIPDERNLASIEYLSLVGILSQDPYLMDVQHLGPPISLRPTLKGIIPDSIGKLSSLETL
jgi:hypothetical protein